MKEKYLRPAVVSAGNLEIGIIPFAATAAVAGVTVKGALALLAGYMAGRAATKVMEARPHFKLPSLTEGRRIE